MSSQIDIENGAGIGRVTCGWKLPQLSLDHVRPYWRDAHSPTIARRKGVYEYRHYPLDPVRADLFENIAGIAYQPKADEQLMWLSDVRYQDDAALAVFGDDPPADIKAEMLQDINMIVDKSTTYLVLGEGGKTLVDNTGDPAPAGPATKAIYQVFLRAKSNEASFRKTVKALAEKWAKAPGVVRLRLNLFEVPDMEAERRAGYPVKTHPLELQYQAWIDLWLENDAAAKGLMSAADGVNYAADISTIHAYPAPAVYTFNYNNKPTLAGLRGYPAVEAIRNLGAEHQKHPGFLEWLYGDRAKGGTFA